MRTAGERKAINNFLGNRGFATLDDQAGMFRQIGYCVRDHEHFRQMLTACEPQERNSMYGALKPHLQFEAKPLDVYISEAGSIAEAKQLPVIGEGGKLLPFRPTEIESDEFKISEAVRKHLARLKMTVTCRKCTKQAEFFGDRKADCISEARAVGWSYDETKAEGGETCPACLDFVN